MFKHLVIFLLLTANLFSYTLKERLEKVAKEGDFAVTLYNKIYTLLLIQKIESNCLTIFEISIPKKNVKNKNFSWKDWVKNGAYKNSSYNIYEIDLSLLKVTSAYSFSQKSFLTISNQSFFFLNLLNTPLTYLEKNKRKKIGPPPLNEEFDQRSLWKPKIIIEGKVKKNIDLSVFTTSIKKNDSALSNKKIDLYFDKNEKFFFPFCIQVTSNHLTSTFKIADSGKNLFTKKIDYKKSD